MEKKDTCLYEVPEIQVYETRCEGIICDSNNTLQGRDGYDTTEENPFES